MSLVGDVISVALVLMRTRVVHTAVLMFLGKGLRYMIVAGVVTTII